MAEPSQFYGTRVRLLRSKGYYTLQDFTEQNQNSSGWTQMYPVSDLPTPAPLRSWCKA